MGWMIRDTLRQSLASRLFWAMMALSAVCILFCLSVRVKDSPRLPLAEGEDKYILPKDDPQLKKIGPTGAPRTAWTSSAGTNCRSGSGRSR